MVINVVFLSSGGQSGVKMLANFSKTAKQKPTPLVMFVELLEIRIIFKKMSPIGAVFTEL